MRNLILTNDHVLLSFVSALLADAGIQVIHLDRNMSALEGSIGVLPRRLAVTDDDWPSATRLLREADLGQWITDR